MAEPRRYYVITGKGEAGPFTGEDLAEELRARRIQPGDQVRTAFGTSTGTVADILGSPLQQTQGTMEARRTSDRHPSRRPSSRSAGLRVPGPSPMPLVSPMTLGLGVAAILVGAALVWARVESTREAPSPPGIYPPGQPVRTNTDPQSGTRPGPIAPPVAQQRGDSPSTSSSSPPTRPGGLFNTPPLTPLPPPDGKAPSRKPPHGGPYGGTPQRIPGVLALERYDEGGEGLSYHDSDTVRNGEWPGRSAESVDLFLGPDGRSAALGLVRTGEWIEYTCQIDAPGRYAWTVACTRDPGKKFGGIDLVWSIDQVPVGPPLHLEDHAQGMFTGTVELPGGLQVLRLGFTGDVVSISGIAFAPTGN